MLILNRKKDEAILIGDNIEVRICRIRGNIVRVGITAPPDIIILRKELQQESQREDALGSAESTQRSPADQLDPQTAGGL